jgi:THO complex subunit 4
LTFYLGRPIKIEIIIDSDTDVGPAPATPVPSLLGRIGKVAGAPKYGLPAPQSQIPNGNVLPMCDNNLVISFLFDLIDRADFFSTAQKIKVAPRTAQTGATNAVVKRRKKKGPRRLNKSNVGSKSILQLDQDMEEYRASANGQKSDQ